MVKCKKVERSTFMPLIKSVNTHRCIEQRYNCFVLQFHYIIHIFWDMYRRQGSSQWKESCWKWDRMLQDLNTLIMYMRVRVRIHVHIRILNSAKCSTKKFKNNSPSCKQWQAPNVERLRKCGKCGLRSYCGVACQMKDWEKIDRYLCCDDGDDDGDDDGVWRA